MRYLLDTMTVSEFGKNIANPAVAEFLEDLTEDDVYISAVSIGEFHFGWHNLPVGKRRAAVCEWVEATTHQYSGRIVPVDDAVAKVWGEIRVMVRRKGYEIALPDLLIAATAVHHDLTVVARNVKDFAPTGCKIHNPRESDT